MSHTLPMILSLLTGYQFSSPISNLCIFLIFCSNVLILCVMASQSSLVSPLGSKLFPSF